jgi:hypothetical protein
MPQVRWQCLNISVTKTPGPVGRKAMHALMPIFFKVMNFEKVVGREQRYQIDWDAPASDGTSAGG